MANKKVCWLPLCLAWPAFFLSTVYSSPYHNTLDTPSYSPLPKYLAITRDNPNSSPYPPPTSSLSPTSPVYTDQRSYPSDRAEYSDDDYDSGALSGIPSTSSPAAPHSREHEPEYSPVPEKNTGFVEPIDFSSLLKNVGSMPNTVALAGGASNSNPLFASESRDTFSGFFGSSKNPFEELSRLNTASSNQNPSGQYGEQENVGFVNPDVQFRSLFQSSGIAGDSTGFEAKDFLGSKGAQTKVYPSYTYSGRGSQNEDDEEEEDNDDRDEREDSDRQYRHRQGEPERSNSPSESDEEDEDESEPVYYAASPGSKERRGNERTTQRQAPAESSNSPQTKSKSPEKKSPKCKKIEKQIDYASEDHESFTEPDEDYDPSTYQGRYKRQTRQRGGRGGKAGKRPLTCYVCEDDEGHFAENCSFDSSASPNKDGNNYYHSESSSSYNDNGRRGKANRG